MTPRSRRTRPAILVVGDLMCDHYIWGDVERISPEAPVQVLRWEREADKPGGAANVAMNLAALGCQVHLVGLVGDDPAGKWLVRTLRRSKIDTTGVVTSADRPTTVKTRVIARSQHMLRIDRETRTAASRRDERRLVAAIKRRARASDAIICSEYGKGVLGPDALKAITRGRHEAFVLVDPKGRDFARYRGADLLTPNERELTESTPAPPAGRDGDGIETRAHWLMTEIRLENLLVTRGAQGMDLFERQGRRIQRTHIPVAQRHEVFDVTGAGDTVAAVLAASHAAGMTLVEAARRANAAAGIVVGMVGTAVADADALGRVLDGEASQVRTKVLSTTEMARRVREVKAHAASVVLTAGPFEAIDSNCLHLLQRARALGDVLVVAVTDARAGAAPWSVPAPQRAEVLAALRFVDYVTVIPERGGVAIVEAVRPDVLVAPDTLAEGERERRRLEQYCGRVVVPGADR